MSTPSATYRPWLHRFAQATVATTMLLIFVGGVVTNTGSALAVPDWPTSFGYNMFLYPWSKMVGGIFYEHSHRLLGSLVGMLTLTMTVWIHIVDPRRWVRRMATTALVMVIVQGILGGMRVVFLADQLAVVHGCLAQAFLSLLVGITVVESRWWLVDAVSLADRSEAAVLRFRGLATAGVFYLQIVTGALLTHVSGDRLDLHLLVGAVAVGAALSLAARVLTSTPSDSGLPSFARLLLALLALQLVLGFGAMIVRFDVSHESYPLLLALPTLHRLVGASLVATAMALAWRVAGATNSSHTDRDYVVAAPGAAGWKVVA